MAVTSKPTTSKSKRPAPGKPEHKAETPNLMLTSDDIHLFANGMWQRAWEKMGAHKDTQHGLKGWLFRV